MGGGGPGLNGSPELLQVQTAAIVVVQRVEDACNIFVPHVHVQQLQRRPQAVLLKKLRPARRIGPDMSEPAKGVLFRGDKGCVAVEGLLETSRRTPMKAPLDLRHAAAVQRESDLPAATPC